MLGQVAMHKDLLEGFVADGLDSSGEETQAK